MRRSLEQPDLQKRFIEAGGAEAVGMSSAEFLARIKQDGERYRRIIKAANVKPE